MPLPRGRYRYKVRFERRKPDDAGDLLGDWAVLCGPYAAAIVPLGGKKEVLAEAATGISPYQVTVDSTPATRLVLPSDRCVDTRSGQVFNITGISNPDQRNIELVMLCTYGQAQG